MVLINWTNQAKNDLKGIVEYISKDSKRYALLLVNRIRQKTQITKSQPYIGRVVPEIGNDRFRELLEGNYRIIYKIVTETRIDIITVHHSARDLSNRNL